MNSLSAEQINMILGVSIGLALIFGIIAVVLYNKSKHLSDKTNDSIKRLTDGLNSKQAQLEKSDIEISKLKSELKAISQISDARSLELAELEGKLSVLKSENAKLLKAASDDVTINIKTEEAIVPVERKKRPYFRRKNAGSNNPGPKMGKRKPRA